MSPPPALNAGTVQRRLVLMRQQLDQLAELRGITATELADDWLKRAALERTVALLVDLATQINTHVVAAQGGVPSPEYRASFMAAADAGVLPVDLAERLAPSAGLRNVLVHQYLDADLRIVAGAIEPALDDYGEYVRVVARWLRQ